jgi:hypothetical protein
MQWNRDGQRIEHQCSSVQPGHIRDAWRELRAMDGDEEVRRKAGVDDIHLYAQVVEFMFRRAAWQATRITKPKQPSQQQKPSPRSATTRSVSKNHNHSRISTSSVSYGQSMMNPRISIKVLSQFNYTSESRMSFNMSRDMFAELFKLQQEGSYELTPAVYGDMIAANLTAGHYLQRTSHWKDALQLAEATKWDADAAPNYTLLQKMVQLCPTPYLPLGPVQVLSLTPMPNTYMFNLVLQALNNAGYHQDAGVIWETLVAMQGSDEYLKAMKQARAEVEGKRGAEEEGGEGPGGFRSYLEDNDGKENEAPDVWTSATTMTKGYSGAVLDRSKTEHMIGASGSGRTSIRPDKYTISSVVHAYTRSHLPHHAYATVNVYWEECEKEGGGGLGASTDLVLLNSALYACTEMGNIGLMEDIIARIAALGSTPDNYTIHALLLALCRGGRIREAYRMLLEWHRFADEQDIEDKEAQGRESRLAGMKGTRDGSRTAPRRGGGGGGGGAAAAAAAAAATSAGRGGRGGSQHTTTSHNNDSKLRPTVMSFNVILYACHLTRDLDFANEVMNKMDSTGIVPNDATFRIVLAMFGDSLVWKGLFGGRLAMIYEKIKRDAEKDSQSPKWHRELEDGRKAWELERQTDQQNAMAVAGSSAKKKHKIKIKTWLPAEERKKEEEEKKSSGLLRQTKGERVSAEAYEQQQQQHGRSSIKEAKNAGTTSGYADIHHDERATAQSSIGSRTEGMLGMCVDGEEHGRILDVRRLSEMEVKLLLKDCVEALIEETSPNTTTLRNIDMLILTGAGKSSYRSARRVFNTMGIEALPRQGGRSLFLAGEEIEAYAIREANEASMEELRRTLMFRGSLLATMVLGPLFVAPSLMDMLNAVV